MHFIGIITNKNSENNIKKIMRNNCDDNKIIFLNSSNLQNFKNVMFDSIVINNDIDNEEILNKIIQKSKYILCNSDIKFKDEIKNYNNNRAITYGFNSNAFVTISSVTDDNMLIYIQKEIEGYNKITGMQEIKFEKYNKNVNVYDGMIATIINLIYEK